MSAFFWIFGLIAIAGAIGVVAARTPVHSLMALVVNFVALAVLYLSLNAEFLAIIQIIVYAGAILILFLFVIALLSVTKGPIERPTGKLIAQKELGIVASAAAGAFLIVAIFRGISGGGAEGLVEDFGTAASFGKQLLTTHVFPFELTAFVLMVAVIGVIVLVGRQDSRSDTQR